MGESEVGVGSTFHFTVALDLADVPDTSSLAPLPPHLDVLIVDDNEINRRILGEQVRRWGMTPTLIASGPAAIEALTAPTQAGRPFALLLLDANMPGMDGFAVAAEIVSRTDHFGVTVMMLSSSGEYGDHERCAELKIKTYLTKPVYAPDLLAAIGRAIGTRRQRCRLRRSRRLAGSDGTRRVITLASCSSRTTS